MDELETDDGATGGEGAPPASAEPPPSCFACGAATIGPFCAACGQKNDDMRRSILVLLGETLAAVFALDSRAFRTIRTIAARPGRFVREYGDGVRSRYTPPIRLYVLVSLFFFMVVALSGTNFIAFQLEFRTPDGELLAAPPDSPDTDTQVNFRPVFLQPKSETSDIDRFRELIDAALEDSQIEPESAGETDAQLAADESGTAESSAENGVTDEQIASFRKWSDAALTVLERPAVFNAAFNEWLPRVMFVMAPLLAVFLALGIRGKDALIYDHLLLSLIIHAVAFFGLAVAVFAARMAPGGAVAGGLTVFVTGYLIVALKGAYRRGWVKTIWTAVFASVLYWIALGAALVAIGAFAFMRIAGT